MNDILQHVGVLGMHWGHRSGSSSHSSSDHTTTANIKRKKLHEMSNEEIRTLANRMQLEKQYKDLNPSKIARGGKAVDNALNTMGKITAAAATITAAAVLGKKLYFLIKPLVRKV